MAEPRKKVPYRFSPFGSAVHPWLNKADTKFNAEGLYKTGLRHKLTDPGVAEQRAQLDAESQEAFEELTADLTPGERKKWKLYVPYTLEEDEQGNETGFITFHYKQNAVIKLRDGTTKEIKVGLKDAKNEDMHKPIFGGSTLRTLYKPRAIKMTSAKEAGIRLDLAAVQVTKLQSSSGGRGFGVVEGGYSEDDDDADERGQGFGGAPATSPGTADY